MTGPLCVYLYVVKTICNMSERATIVVRNTNLRGPTALVLEYAGAEERADQMLTEIQEFEVQAGYATIIGYLALDKARIPAGSIFGGHYGCMPLRGFGQDQLTEVLESVASSE